MITGQKIVVYGLGIEGLSAVKYLSKNNEVTVLDDRDIRKIDTKFTSEAKKYTTKIFLGKYNNLQKFDLVIRSPGVRPDHPVVKKLILAGATLTSATNIFFHDFHGEIIGVTGTKGKGTTTTLIYQLLKTRYNNVLLAGNIGVPMLGLLPKINPNSKVVLELSSFQLMGLTNSPHVAVVLMTTSEHLNWHKNINEYLSAKSNIVKYQTAIDYAVINKDFPNSKVVSQNTLAKKYFFSTKNKTNGIYIKGDKIISVINGPQIVCKTQDVRLVGPHNLQNVAAAVSVAEIYGIKKTKILKVVKSFKGLSHRLQLVATKNGVKYYNDSFSTTPETTIAAIDSFSSPKIMILGGSSKNSDFTNLVKKIKETPSVKACILLGEEAKKLNGMLKAGQKSNLQIITGLNSMVEVVDKCSRISIKGDIVLLSPAAASFGMFKNYKNRGDQFVREVNKLNEKIKPDQI